MVWKAEMELVMPNGSWICCVAYIRTVAAILKGGGGAGVVFW
jgi:hypothetical protein